MAILVKKIECVYGVCDLGICDCINVIRSMRQDRLVRLVIAILLLMCLLPWSGSYGVYYEILRFATTTGFATLAYWARKEKKENEMIQFVILTILFNPFFPVRLGRPVWIVVDVVLALYLLSPFVRKPKHAQEKVVVEQKSVGVLPLIIDEDYRIYYPFINRVEVMLTPLPKALYLLFVNHPEGIAFKDLSDHRNELMDIYRKLALSEDDAKMTQSINDLVDPTSNSVNEKAYRIKEAFCKILPDEQAQDYYLTGDRGGVKRVKWMGFIWAVKNTE